MVLFRAGLRSAGAAARQQTTASFFAQRFASPFRQQQKRLGSTATEGASQSWFQRMWNSPVGIKTVHFWAPVMKWAIVLAGVSDFARPVEKLSLTQNGALTATGVIWTRWCFVITPKNYLLAAVNFFLGIVGITQLTRIALYRQSLKSLPAAAEEEAKKTKDEVKEIVKS